MIPSRFCLVAIAIVFASDIALLSTLLSLFDSVRVSFRAVVSVSSMLAVPHSEHVVMSILALVRNYIPSHQHVSIYIYIYCLCRVFLCAL